MAKKLLFTAIWTAVFLAGSVALLFLGFFIAGSVSYMDDGSPVLIFSRLWEFTPIIGGALGCLLGLFGCLPGTRSSELGNGRVSNR